LQAQLKAYIQVDKNLENGKNNRWDLNEKLGLDKAKAIRHKLFHVSFNYRAVGMSPRIGSNGLPVREVIAG
jgi:hypothetical protein